MARPLKPRTPLAERLIAVREKLGFLKRDGFAESLGILADTLGTYERGVAAPSPDLLAVYHRQHGVNMNWLLTGEGNMLDDPSKTPPPSTEVDPWVMERLYVGAELTYREIGRPISGNAIAREAAMLFNALLARISDIRDKPMVEAAIKVLIAELKERLITAEPGTGKASA